MSAVAERVRAAVEPPLAAAGFDVEDVAVRQAGQRRLVQVVVDRDGGVDLDAVAEASRAISEVLDVDDVVDGAYVLEVTSPGVDRPLTLPRHWRRNVGRLVEVSLADGTSVTGRLRSADGSHLVLEVAGEPQTLVLGDVRRGTVQLEFTRPTGTPGLDGTDDVDELDDDGDDDELDDDDEEGSA